MGSVSFREIASLLHGLRDERLSEKSFIDSIATIIRSNPEEAEFIMRMLKMDFGEASRLLGTHLIKRIVSEALAMTTPLSRRDVEDLLEKNSLEILFKSKSSTLFERHLSIRQVYFEMLDVCRIKGKSSIGPKARKLACLLGRVSREEAIFIVSVLTGRQRPLEDEAILRITDEVSRYLSGSAWETSSETH
ncbi:MAG: hypothetical protein ACUVQ0_01950 [Thermoproteota archaeon]